MHRLAAFVIIAFWFVMTLLLVRNEMSPDASRLREVPIAHVLKLVFLHEQPSDLTIRNGPTPLGSMRLHPRIDRATQARVLDLSGDLHLALGPEQRTRFNWMGSLEMTPAFDLLRSKWNMTVSEPGYVRLEIETSGAGKATRYSLRTRETTADGGSRERVISEGELPSDKNGIAGLAAQFNLGANLDALVQQSAQRTPPVIRARQSSLHWRGERTDTYLITIEQDDQNLVEAHVSQLGQVLLARTFIGYTLRSSDLAE